jgi:hypothetical protein
MDHQRQERKNTVETDLREDPFGRGSEEAGLKKAWWNPNYSGGAA